MSQNIEIAVVGAGAAGLMAAIWAGRVSATTSPSKGVDGRISGGVSGGMSGGVQHPKIVAFDGARTLGAKILVAGGGRCNVTHDVVTEQAFAGASRNAIRKVLKRFDVPQTIEFFRTLGVELKHEETGKLFPTTDKARTVLNALLHAAHDADVQITFPWRVHSIQKNTDSRFLLRSTDNQEIVASKVIIATGGRSLPKTGSDGHGYSMVRSLGHTITQRVFPALVPLTLPANHFLCKLSGISSVVTLQVESGTGKKLTAFTDSMLCTHFGISGPAALDISRYFTDARTGDPNAGLFVNWLPQQSAESVDSCLLQLGKTSVGRWLREGESESAAMPARLTEAICEQADVSPSAPANQLTRDRRKALSALLTHMHLPITGDRGFGHAEVTAGGVPLNEIRLETMESRICPNLYMCGEICDVDGRIGGYNFQWAWASGFVAGTSAGSSLET